MIDEVRFVNSPREWPRWPFLPLVNRETRELGFLFAMDSPPYQLIFGNVFGLPAGTYNAFMRHAKTRVYASAEALLKEWRID